MVVQLYSPRCIKRSRLPCNFVVRHPDLHVHHDIEVFWRMFIEQQDTQPTEQHDQPDQHTRCEHDVSTQPTRNNNDAIDEQQNLRLQNIHPDPQWSEEFATWLAM